MASGNDAQPALCQYGSFTGEGDCDQPAKYRRHPFCHRHYLRLYKAGRLTPPPSSTSAPKPSKQPPRPNDHPESLASALKGKAPLQAAREKLETHAEKYADLHF